MKIPKDNWRKFARRIIEKGIRYLSMMQKNAVFQQDILQKCV